MFKEIKVGDIALALRTIQTRRLRQESFFVPVAVKRVTAKQFVLDNGLRCWKEDGRTVGDPYQKCYWIGNGWYTDQSVEMRERKEQARKSKVISDIISDLNRTDFLDNKEQDKILVLLGKAKELSQTGVDNA